jgi:chromate transporter
MILVLLQLAGLFALLSMLAFGGGAGVIPDMQRAAVDHYHWLTAKEFLVGLKAAGLAGAAVSFTAMFAPSCLAVYLVARYWQRAARAAWRALVERALAPVAVGLTLASGLSLMRGTEHGWLPWGVTIVSTALFSVTNINPILLLILGAGTLLLVGS